MLEQEGGPPTPYPSDVGTRSRIKDKGATPTPGMLGQGATSRGAPPPHGCWNREGATPHPRDVGTGRGHPHPRDVGTWRGPPPHYPGMLEQGWGHPHPRDVGTGRGPPPPYPGMLEQGGAHPHPREGATPTLPRDVGTGRAGPPPPHPTDVGTRRGHLPTPRPGMLEQGQAQAKSIPPPHLKWLNIDNDTQHPQLSPETGMHAEGMAMAHGAWHG